ncbi:unnamed protein product [Schistosoma margrebowiei]|uniref:Uncharacterized protein n=1 Tax=Schistosoma margrebowiei TaxID=48269 RepID=A0A183MKD2_9TREM|nr:unnamed protein product [Schistosoma margrebowiei]
MVVRGSQQEIVDPGSVLLGTRQQGVPVILRELALPDGSGPVSPSFSIGSWVVFLVYIKLRALIRIRSSKNIFPGYLHHK